MAKHTIKQALDPKYLSDRIQLALEAELKRQRETGKKFVTDEEIDELIAEVLQEDLKQYINGK